MTTNNSYDDYLNERDYFEKYSANLGKASSNAYTGHFEKSYYERIRSESSKWQDVLRDYSNGVILVPVGAWSFFESLSMPDWDISVLGIGHHRFFLFHSGAAAWLIKRVYDSNFNKSASQEKFSTRVWRKVFGVAAASSVLAIGCHLTIDVFQPKSVIFPGLGSLVDGTLVDDNVWLLGNALYCFKVADDLYSLALGNDYKRVKLFVKERFIKPIIEGGGHVVSSWN